MSVRSFGSNLSRALNLHHSGLYLQAVIKAPSRGLQWVNRLKVIPPEPKILRLVMLGSVSPTK